MKYIVLLVVVVSSFLATLQTNSVLVAIGVLLLIICSATLIIFLASAFKQQPERVYGPASKVERFQPITKLARSSQPAVRHYEATNLWGTPVTPTNVRVTTNYSFQFDSSSSTGVPNQRNGIDLHAIVQGIIIDTPWIDYILQGKKTWEMRSSKCNKRGPIALIKKGSKTIYGVAYLQDSEGPLGIDQLAQSTDFHQIPKELYEASDFRWNHAWKLNHVCKLQTPVAYEHIGGVIWVNLDLEARQKIKNSVLIPV